MHLRRPKTSKGGRQPVGNVPQRAGDRDPRTPLFPEASAAEPGRSLRSRSQPGHLSQEQVLNLVEQAPAAPSHSFNRFRVLPSIRRRPSEAGSSLDQHLSALSLCHDAVPQLEVPGSRPRLLDPETSSSGFLLLAVRAPCGRRFERHFVPTDTLLMVKASAEDQYGEEYGAVAIETMDMPRRSFTDMDVTLVQCGIVNKSLLCITKTDTTPT